MKTPAEKILEHIKARIAELKPPVEHDDGWTPDDYAGGNIDDAYWAGYDHAERDLANDIRELIEG